MDRKATSWAFHTCYVAQALLSTFGDNCQRQMTDAGDARSFGSTPGASEIEFEARNKPRCPVGIIVCEKYPHAMAWQHDGTDDKIAQRFEHDVPLLMSVEGTDIAAKDPKWDVVDRRWKAPQKLGTRKSHVLGERQDLAVSHRRSAARLPVRRRREARASGDRPAERRRR